MINDYPELIAEVSTRSGATNVVNRAGMFVGMAEKMLSKRLRLANMETAIDLTTDSNGSVNLPTDYQEMRSIRVDNRDIERKPLGVVLDGRQCGYAIQAKVLKSTYKSKAHQLVYYAAVPGLEAANTSWLLNEEPELYLQAVLFQTYTANNEIEKAQATAGYLGGLISAANEADHMNRHAGTRINLGKVVP